MELAWHSKRASLLLTSATWTCRRHASAAPRETPLINAVLPGVLSRGQQVPTTGIVYSEQNIAFLRTMDLSFTAGGDFNLAVRAVRLASRSTCAHRCTKQRNANVLGLDGQRQPSCRRSDTLVSRKWQPCALTPVGVERGRLVQTRRRPSRLPRVVIVGP